MIMESYHKSNCEHKLMDVNSSNESVNNRAVHNIIDNQSTQLNTDDCSFLPTMSSVYFSTHHKESQKQLNIDQLLSSQIHKYYRQYSQCSSLNKYNSDSEQCENNWKYPNKTRSNLWKNQEIPCVHKDVTMCMDTLHKKPNSVRPPLIGWPSQPIAEKNITWKEQIVPSNASSSKSCRNQSSQYVFKDDKKSGNVFEHVCSIVESSDRDIKTISPTSSIASQNKPLEWDSLADVGYHNTLATAQDKSHDIFHLTETKLPMKDSDIQLSRLDPEGTTTSLDSYLKDTPPNDSMFQFSVKPNAHSTRLFDDGLELKTDMKLISSVNSDGSVIPKNDHDNNLSQSCGQSNKNNKSYNKLYTRRKINKLTPVPILFDENKGSIDSATLKNLHSPLKRNASMHELVIPLTFLSLKRSQSELNLRETINYNPKSLLTPLNFLSSSSITTIINKPLTCDKNIQTNLNEMNKKTQESKATQASSSTDTNQIKTNEGESCEDSSNKNLHKIKEVKNNIKETVLLEKATTLQPSSDQDSLCRDLENKMKLAESNESSPLESREEVDGGRASNSFEYFPGHIYRNVPDESNIDHRSIRTERSHSTIPNTSSSFDEKLWGDSNSLLRDLERSLNILKSLINTDKYDKQVKKRLIHHVIKRLVTARYSDDKIEHNLEENVPWNPDDARNKIYCTEIIQALAKKQSHDSTEDSLENWKVNGPNCLYNKTTINQAKNFSKMMDFVSSEDSDAFEERTTDKTDGMQDGRRARLGLRSNDKYNRPRYHHKYQMQDGTVIDTDKSGSSECFLPQSHNIKSTEKSFNKPLCSKMMRKGLLSPKSTTRTNKFQNPSLVVVPTTINNVSSSNTITTATSTSTTVTIITSIDTTPFTPTSTTSQSSNNEKKIQSVIGYNDIDWRLPATISERRYKYEKKMKLGTISQLINYVEIEKKNQLLWINNEINHLMDLKKLLEEPTKIEKQEIRREKHHNTISTDKMFEDRWSSHGNLAAASSKTNAPLKTTKSDYTQTIEHNDAFDTSFLDDQDSKRVDESITHSQVNQSDSQQSLSSKTSDQSRKKRNLSHQSHILHSLFQDIGIQTVEDNCINKDENDQIRVITQFSSNSKKETKNILNGKCKSESPITVDEDQEIFNGSKNHCYGCLCNRIKKKSLADQNHDKTTKSSSRKISCNCDVQNQKLLDLRKTNETKENQIDKTSEKIGKRKNKKIHQISQNSTRCPKCGIINTDTKNQKCQCTHFDKKSVAYELFFESKNNNQSSDQSAQLQDYLKKNKPNFVDNVEMRKQYMVEISELREMKRNKIMQLLALASPSNPIIKSKIINQPEKLYRKKNKDQTKMKLRSRYSQSNERKNKRKQQEKSDQLKHNYLMAKIFCKKLQQKVLQGQVTLSHSISVISNL